MLLGRCRWGALLLVALWSIGLLAGSIHPLGWVAAVFLLGASIWLMTAPGIYGSLISRDTAQASNRALIPALVLLSCFIVCYLVPPRFRTVALGAASAPFVNFLSLLSHADVREVVSYRGQKPFSPIRGMGLYTDETPAAVLATFSICAVASTVAAAWLSRLAVARFDRAAGRPHLAGALCDARLRDSATVEMWPTNGSHWNGFAARTRRASSRER